jgi:predicted nucleotidyltransferase
MEALSRGCRAGRSTAFYIDRMTGLAGASLSAGERALLERFAEDLQARLGEELHAVWLFGSCARGELRVEHSDVDVLVLVEDASWEGRMRVRGMLDTAARALRAEDLAWSFSIHVNSPAWLAQRREIDSFFIAEVDRDKIALFG